MQPSLPKDEKLLSRLNAAQFARVDALLDEALDLPPADRAAWLEALRLRESELATHVGALLQNVEIKASNTLDRPPLLREEPEERRFAPGQKVGLYTLESPLGRGGMSEVWRAQRTDETIKRSVALKLPFTGQFDQRILLRFSRERDILARLNHPNIARLYDAGSEGTQPYLAIELIEGLPLRDYCSSYRLDLRARVALFRQVIDAVQYAHTNLLVHRDIKPSNILVTADGVVKLLDFGIAKPTELSGVEDNEATQLTRMAGRVLTPQYASPEQIKGESVSTSSDLYSLGVVLYELITGLTPYASLRALTTPLTPPAREAAVLNDAPTRPSTSPITQAFTDSLNTSPKYLRRNLADGLDAIVMNALAKEPAERYATAQAFGDDLQAWLDGKPVRAQAPSQWYLLRKFVARHRLTVGMGAASVVAVFASAGVAIWEARKATLAAQTTSEVKQFLVDMLSVNSGRKANALSAQANRQTSAEQLLRAASRKMTENPKIAPQVRIELLGVMGDLTHELYMGDEAVKLREQRLDLLKKPEDKASAFLDLIDTLYQAGRVKDADEMVAKTKLFAASYTGNQKELFDARLLMREGRQLDFVGKHAESTPLLERASKQLQAFIPAHKDWLEAQMHYLDGLRTANPEATFQGYRALISNLENRYGKDSTELIPALQQYSAALGIQQKAGPAKEAFARLNALHALNPDFDPVGAAVALTQQGLSLRSSGEIGAARPLLEKALLSFEKANVSDNAGEPTTARLLYAVTLMNDWDFVKANSLYEKVEEVARKAGRGVFIAAVLEARAMNISLQGKTDEARSLFDEARALRLKTLPPTHMTFAVGEGRAIANEVAAGNAEDALKRYNALRSFPDPKTTEIITTQREGAKLDSLNALIASKRWEALISETESIVARPQLLPFNTQRKLTALIYRARAQTELKDYSNAIKNLRDADEAAERLAGDAQQPLLAQLALQKVLTLKASNASKDELKLAEERFKKARALLKGESKEFATTALQIES
jgi:eukaryotic-like serine/threonine-protein kinase